MNENTFCSMVNNGTMDIYIDPPTYRNDIRVNCWLPYVFPFASRYFTKLEVRYIDILMRSRRAHYTGLPHYRFGSLFSFSCSGTPVINSCFIWLVNDGCGHTKRAQRTSLHRRRNKSKYRPI